MHNNKNMLGQNIKRAILSAAGVSLLVAAAGTSLGKRTPELRNEIPEGTVASRGGPGRNNDAATTAQPANSVDLRTIFQPGDRLNTERVYLIEFEEAPIAAHLSQFKDQSIRTLPGGNAGRKARVGRLDLDGAESLRYRRYLADQQAGYLQQIAARAGRQGVRFVYRYALNGVAMTMTPAEAIRVSSIPGVRRVEADRTFKLTTDRGPLFIGAEDIWTGNTSTGLGAQGEGMVIGIIDTGVNGPNPIRAHAGHPSFAEIGGDGYVHSNPYPEFLGECAIEPGLCNNKLVGRYSFVNDFRTPPGDPPSQDTDGHGSHVMGTAGGNVLFDVPMTDVEGNASDYRLERISGVAPHANLIAYKVCYLGYCELVAMLAAIDHAIQEDVDILNLSISGDGSSPWVGALGRAFLNAHAAGIFTATSAGNGGPLAHSANGDKNAPWTLSVAAQTHDRAFALKKLNNLSGGDTAPPAGMTGRGVTGSYTGPIVYAGDFPTANGSANDTQPEQCLAPFPAGTWTDGEIVVCDRGIHPDVLKAVRVRQGGAAGFVLANLGPELLADDRHVIPAIHISASDRARLLSWLASGSNHRASIAAAGPVIADPDAGDVLAFFSSRGPSGVAILVPNVSAPGVAVMAPGADLQFDWSRSSFYTPSAPTEFGVLNGTSMASPHAAGAAALLMQLHPDWSVAELQSALMSTASPLVRKEDGVTPAEPLDVGGGRVQVEQAADAGLLLNESIAGFQAADPDLGGEPSSLNLAGMYDWCLTGCTWERTVTAMAAGTWDVSIDGERFSVHPDRFTLNVGESETIAVTSNVIGLERRTFVSGRVTLRPHDQSLPVQILPAAAFVAPPLLPDEINITAFSESGTWNVPEIETVAITQFAFKTTGLDRATQITHDLDQDTASETPFDNLEDGVSVDFVNVPTGSTRLVAEIARAAPNDLNLFVGIDLNGDGVATEDEVVCAGAPHGRDVCELDVPQQTASLLWWVLVQNVYSYSYPGVYDPFTVAVTVVGENDDGNLRIEGPAGSLPELTRFDIRAIWNAEIDVGDIFYGSVRLDSHPSSPGDIGTFPVRLECPQTNETPHVGGVCGNRWPIFTSSPVADAAVGGLYEYAVVTSDRDLDDALSISAESLPDWLSLTSSGGHTAMLTGTAQPHHLGQNPVSLRVTDAAGDSRVQDFSITVTDETPPVITLIGPEVMTLRVGDAFQDPGARAWDDVDGDVSARIITTTYVDTTRAGEWVVFYDVSDSAGHAAERVSRAVVVTRNPSSGGAGGESGNGSGGGGASDLWLLLVWLIAARSRRIDTLGSTCGFES